MRDYRHLEFSLLPSRLQENAEQALVAVTHCVVKGETLVRCQLLASIFYEALRRELRQFPSTENPERAFLVAAVDHCGRAAITSVSPADLLHELQSAVAMLSDRARPTGVRPMLRVIEGGLSKT